MKIYLTLSFLCSVKIPLNSQNFSPEWVYWHGTWELVDRGVEIGVRGVVEKGGFCEILSHSFFPLLSQTPSQFSLFTRVGLSWDVGVWQIVVLRSACVGWWRCGRSVSRGGISCWVWYSDGLWFGHAICVVVVAKLGSCV